MEIASIIDQELAPPHGNRKGLSYGQLAVLFLTYVVSQSDHRLCAVEPWVEKHRQTLEIATGWNIGAKDATDDRLADLLSIIGASEEERRDRIALSLTFKRRKQQQTKNWSKRYSRRAGVEGTISQGVRALGLRNSRYVGLDKVH
jgi:hypothetical protein